MIADPGRRFPGSAMPRLEMPTAILDLIIGFLAHDATGPDVPPPPANGAKPSPASGAALYAKWCASCHGNTGKGDGPNARYQPIPPARHADAGTMSRRADDALFDIIAAGGLAWGRSARMPAFGSTLTEGEIRALVSRIRELCACRGPAW
jgi:mono/diheme cytochrome c family protein